MKTTASIITIYEQHNDGSPALWTERDGETLFVCDANARDEIDVEELEEYVADWRAHMNESDRSGCAYCGAVVQNVETPEKDDDDAWRALAVEHAPTCEWIATRAHWRTQRETVESLATLCAQEALKAAMTGDEIAVDSDGFALIDASAAGPTVFDFEALQDAIGFISDEWRHVFEDTYKASLHAELERLEASNA